MLFSVDDSVFFFVVSDYQKFIYILAVPANFVPPNNQWMSCYLFAEFNYLFAEFNLGWSMMMERRWLGVRTAGLEFRKVAGSNPRSGRVPMSFSKNLCTINTDCSYGEGQHREETHTWELGVLMLGERRWAVRHLSRWAWIFWRKVDTSSTTR